MSDYMKLAVEEFGKPRIELIGDRSLYPGWVNVTDVVPMFAFGSWTGTITSAIFFMPSSPTWKTSSLIKTPGSGSGLPGFWPAR